MSLEHPNQTKKFKPGYIHNARPDAKAFRFEADDNIKELAKEVKRLATMFELGVHDISKLIKQEFGEGVGIHTTLLFLDDVYGPAFRLRAKTLDKYRYFVWLLRQREKQFAKPKK